MYNCKNGNELIAVSGVCCCVQCLLMCVLFHFYFIYLHVCAYAFKSKVHCGSASARRFRASLFLHTTCDRSAGWCTWSASCAGQKKIKTKRYCSTVQGLLDWIEVDLGFTKLFFIQTDLCVVCAFDFYALLWLSSCSFWTSRTASPTQWESALNLVGRMMCKMFINNRKS